MENSLHEIYYDVGNGLEVEYIEATSFEEALGKFFILNSGLCYNDIVSHM
jgi:hypothetical protein